MRAFSDELGDSIGRRRLVRTRSAGSGTVARRCGSGCVRGAATASRTPFRSGRTGTATCECGRASSGPRSTGTPCRSTDRTSTTTAAGQLGRLSEASQTFQRPTGIPSSSMTSRRWLRAIKGDFRSRLEGRCYRHKEAVRDVLNDLDADRRRELDLENCRQSSSEDD